MDRDKPLVEEAAAFVTEAPALDATDEIELGSAAAGAAGLRAACAIGDDLQGGVDHLHRPAPPDGLALG